MFVNGYECYVDTAALLEEQQRWKPLDRQVCRKETRIKLIQLALRYAAKDWF